MKLAKVKIPVWLEGLLVAVGLAALQAVYGVLNGTAPVTWHTLVLAVVGASIDALTSSLRLSQLPAWLAPYKELVLEFLGLAEKKVSSGQVSLTGGTGVSINNQAITISATPAAPETSAAIVAPEPKAVEVAPEVVIKKADPAMVDWLDGRLAIQKQLAAVNSTRPTDESARIQQVLQIQDLQAQLASHDAQRPAPETVVHTLTVDAPVAPEAK